MIKTYPLVRAFAAVGMLVGLLATSIVPAQAEGLTPAFNTKAADHEFLTGKRVGTPGDPMDPVENVQPDEEVEVHLYYHNSVADTEMQNFTVKVNLPNSETIESTHVITGQLSADGITPVTGTIPDGQTAEIGKPGLTINTTQATKLAYVPGSLQWFPNQTEPGKDAPMPLPTGQVENNLIAGGLNLGSLKGCFQYSGKLIFRVKLGKKPETPPPPVEYKATLSLQKTVRKANSSEPFRESAPIRADELIEYQIKVKNTHTVGVAKNIFLKDVLPAEITYVGPTQVTFRGTTTTVAGTLTGDGLMVADTLQPQEEVVVTFLAKWNTTLKDQDCKINSVSVKGDNLSTTPSDSRAETCYLNIPPTPTPTPATPTPATPAPQVPHQPILPKTGPEMGMFALFGLTGMGTSVGRYAYLKQQLRKQSRNIDVLS